MQVENFVRGLVEGDANKGQVMWRADFHDQPAFQQQLRSLGSPYMPMAFLGWGMDMGYSNPYCDNFGNDSYYMPVMILQMTFLDWTPGFSQPWTGLSFLRMCFAIP